MRATVLRTCIGCRTRRPQGELLRFRRRPDGQVVPANRAHAGRSAYLCPSQGCYNLALRRRAFPRSLAGPRGLSVSLDATNLWGVTQNELEEELRLREGGTNQSRRATALATLLQGMRAPNEGGA